VNEKDTYNHLVAAFELQWPFTVILKALKEDCIQELKDWTLKIERTLDGR
jgi:hypothetical protein